MDQTNQVQEVRLEYQLASKLPEISATDAFAAVKSIGLSELGFNGQSKRLVSHGGRDARRILFALAIKQINPPCTPESAAEESKKKC